MSSELIILLICCIWPCLWMVGGWWLRGAYEKRREAQQS